MALNVTLGQLIEDVQFEASMSATPSAGQNFRANIAYRLRSEQKRLYADFQWTHMKGTLENGWFDKPTVNGQRYYDYPTGLDTTSLPKLFYKWGTAFQPVTRGISPENYSSFDSDAGAGSDPAIRWQPHTAAQFEIWPIPQSDGNLMRWTGKRVLRPLLAESDEADLDDLLLVLSAAQAIVRRRAPKEADEILARFSTHYKNLKHGQMTGTDFSFAQNKEPDLRDPTQQVLTATKIVQS